jgi:methylated-DNA-protein-cysteine methyltransferase-like protein
MFAVGVIAVIMTTRTSAHDLILAVVARIPKGRVATYGQIARLAGLPGHARLVGYALHALPEHSRVPWHRVINAKGRISLRSDGLGHDQLQRALLQRERVRFNAQGVISLERFQWRPET